MRDINTVTLIGRMTKDPELKTTATGKHVCSFSIAVDTSWSKEPIASFFNCTAWEATAKFICDYLRKGNRVAITGSLNQRAWETDGKKISVVEIDVKQIMNLTPKQQVVTESVPKIDESQVIPF